MSNSVVGGGQFPKLPPSIYYGGCCFGAAFYCGVHKGLTHMYGPDYYLKCVQSGGSAGTIFAIGIALGKSPEYMEQLYKDVSLKADAKGPIWWASYYMENALRDMLNEDPLSYKKLEGRCAFASTVFFAKHHYHISWESNEDVIRCVSSSYHVPFYCKRSDQNRGHYRIDGAYVFSGIDLLHGDETLYCGFDPHAEIACQLTNAEMFYPVTGAAFDKLSKEGFDATVNWDGKLIHKVGFRQPNYPMLLVLWVLKFWEILVFYVVDNLFFLFLRLLLLVVLFAIYYYNVIYAIKL